MATAGPRRYAQALLDNLPGAEEMERVEKDLDALHRILLRLPACGRQLANPAVPLDRRRALLETALSPLGPHNATRAILSILLEKRLVSRLGDILAAYRRLKDRRLGMTAATVTTAVPVSAADRPAWESALAGAAGTNVRVEYHTDPSLIGGAVARVGSVLYDGSVRGSLERIRQSLLGD